jgi:hypothetical protein
MQLMKKSPIKVALAAATTSLLTAAVEAQTVDDVGWEFDTSVLYYGEQDDRVEDLSAAIRAARRFEDGRALVVGISTDTLTGATPTGAVPLDQPQTFTRPSAKGQYLVDPGKLPLDDSFKDSRVAAYVSWTQPLRETWSGTVGLSFSGEYDYTHMGVNGSLSKELNNRNTTLNTGFAYARDEWDPEGGIPIPLSAMRGVKDRSNKDGKTEDKSVVDFLVGVNQIINQNMIAQLNYSFSQSDDYLNDPFKFLTVLDSNGDPVPGAAGLNLYRFENRPNKRTKHSVFAKLKTFMGGGALDTSYRFMTDDWGIDSHTVDVRYRFNLNNRHYLEPHVRWYQQSEADFFRANLIAAEPVPEEASADYRLAKFTGITIGMKYGMKLNSGSEVSARLEWYSQSGDSNLIGVPQSTNVFPDLDAVILQLNYRFRL